MLKNNNSIPVYHFNNGIESTIPFDRYDKLCSCVFCWNHLQTTTCSACDKRYCLEHETNHICIKEGLIVTHSVLSMTKQEYEPMEIMIA